MAVPGSLGTLACLLSLTLSHLARTSGLLFSSLHVFLGVSDRLLGAFFGARSRVRIVTLIHALKLAFVAHLKLFHFTLVTRFKLGAFAILSALKVVTLAVVAIAEIVTAAHVRPHPICRDPHRLLRIFGLHCGIDGFPYALEELLQTAEKRLDSLFVSAFVSALIAACTHAVLPWALLIRQFLGTTGAARVVSPL